MRDYQTKANDGGGADSITSTKLGAGEFNSVATELENAVDTTGQTLAANDGAGEVTNQLAQAQFIYGCSSASFLESGAANAYVATPVTGSSGLVVPTDYDFMNGAIITFIPGNANTGASTLNIGQTSGTLLGAKAIVADFSGTALSSGAIDTTNMHEFMFSVSLDSWVFIGKKRAADATDPLLVSYAKYSDTKASTTAGGTFTSGSWAIRTINTEDSDVDGIGTLASNQITLAAGTYIVHASAPAYEVQEHAARLWDDTNSAVLLTGTSERSASGNQTRSIITGQFTLAGSAAIEVQHYCGNTEATNGLGYPSSIASRSEVYTVIEIWRVG